MSKRVYSFKADDAMINFLREEAAARGVSCGAVIRDALLQVRRRAARER